MVLFLILVQTKEASTKLHKYFIELFLYEFFQLPFEFEFTWIVYINRISELISSLVQQLKCQVQIGLFRAKDTVQSSNKLSHIS